MRCESYLLATVSSLAIGAASVVSPASAADLPARMPVKAPVIAQPAPFNWTGFYIGIHGGGAWLKHKQTTFEGNGACNNGGGAVASDCTLDTIFNPGGSFTAWRSTAVGSASSGPSNTSTFKSLIH
jgi:predicted outer membrane repeat protein